MRPRKLRDLLPTDSTSTTDSIVVTPKTTKVSKLDMLRYGLIRFDEFKDDIAYIAYDGFFFERGWAESVLQLITGGGGEGG